MFGLPTEDLQVLSSSQSTIAAKILSITLDIETMLPILTQVEIARNPHIRTLRTLSNLKCKNNHKSLILTTHTHKSVMLTTLTHISLMLTTLTNGSCTPLSDMLTTLSTLCTQL